ncbi:uncharacterized protein RHO25_013166 [Cercospora beticola]|nr:hypothetical protein RHO25_013166 [Cercospora beticola]
MVKTTPTKLDEHKLGFLNDIPAELRNKVYKHVGEIVAGQQANWIFKFLQAHPMIRREASSIVFNHGNHVSGNIRNFSIVVSLEIFNNKQPHKLKRRLRLMPHAVRQLQIPLVIYLKDTHGMSLYSISRIMFEIFNTPTVRAIPRHRLQFEFAEAEYGPAPTLLKHFFEVLFATLTEKYHLAGGRVGSLGFMQVHEHVYRLLALRPPPLQHHLCLFFYMARWTIRETYLGKQKNLVGFQQWMDFERRHNVARPANADRSVDVECRKSVLSELE